MWSECSWVIRMALREAGSTSKALSRSNVSLRLKPASTRRRVRPEQIRVQLPELEDARTVTETIRLSPLKSALPM